MPGAIKRFGFLLGTLLVFFFFLGVAPEEDWARAITTVLSGVTLLLSLRVAYMPERRFRVAAAVVVILVIATVATVFATDGDSVVGTNLIANGVLVAIAPPAVVIGVGRTLRAHGAVTLETVFGALCLFLFVGLFFAFVFGAVDRLGGSPFLADGVTATPAKLVYFSFTTLTTVGYGDYSARSDLGHTLSATEALVGQVYLVTVVALIVGNLSPRRRSRS